MKAGQGAGKKYTNDLIPPHPNPLPHWGRGDKEGGRLIHSLRRVEMTGGLLKTANPPKSPFFKGGLKSIARQTELRRLKTGEKIKANNWY
jgi:hypothetical protein